MCNYRLISFNYEMILQTNDFPYIELWKKKSSTFLKHTRLTTTIRNRSYVSCVFHFLLSFFILFTLNYISKFTSSKNKQFMYLAHFLFRTFVFVDETYETILKKRHLASTNVPVCFFLLIFFFLFYEKVYHRELHVLIFNIYFIICVM